MYFLGDLAVNDNIVVDRDFSENEYLVVNCEGYLNTSKSQPKFNSGVFNNVDVILSAFPKEKLILSLANNHIMDKVDGVEATIDIAESNRLLYTGANLSLDSALKPLIVIENGVEVALISAGWDLIGCLHATYDSQGVFPLLRKYLMSEINKQVEQGRKVALFLHWGYETEMYPLPLHRNMAFEFIDAGVDIIVGCHAHCLQGYEVYNGKHIFYGIGNSAFQQGFYYEGKLNFPKYCDVGLAVNWSPINGEVMISETKFCDNKLIFSDFSCPERSVDLVQLSKFNGMNSKEYVEFFRVNRVKRKGLPVFVKKDNSLDYMIKLHYVKFRAKLIHFLFKIGIKRR
ncbi:CapA family protein [Shewanella chilikensis]|uniref:CapA family protein n=1 Tax=Shewanella chilikensis TaxID=558541 RepID=UPI003999E7A0